MKKLPALRIKDFKKIDISRWTVPLITSLVVTVILIISLATRNGQPQTQKVSEETTPVIENPDIIPLPSPSLRSSNSIEAVLKINQPRRSFQTTPLSLKQVGQMLFAAQGVTANWGGRTVNSEKSVFPLSTYLLVKSVEKLEPGLYQYVPGDRLPAHQLLPLKLGDMIEILYTIVNQTPLKEPPAVIVLSGNFSKMAEAYGGVAHNNEVILEAGAAAQNMYLQAESLRLGMVALPNFDAANVKSLLSLPGEETIFYIIPFGLPQE